MRFEPERSFMTSIGWEDPRTEPGELLWPERFGEREVVSLERQMGPWTSAGQLQQRPEPKGGGVIKREWWQLWEREKFPPLDYVMASLDTAYTTKTENDYSAMTVWGVFSGGNQGAIANRVIGRDSETISMIKRTYTEEHPKVMMMFAWQERLELHELVLKVSQTMKDYKVDKILIENKAAGISTAQEIRRLYGHEDFAVQLVDPKSQDKLSRLYSVQHLFAEGLIFAPDRTWADQVITQVSTFPKGKHDDLVDTVSMALRHLREIGLLVRGDEFTADLEGKMHHTGSPPPSLYGI
jgi:predicted phage terminase large subunit-like protein